MLMYALQEEGLDHRETVRQMVADADIGRVVQDRMEAATRRTLASERFLGSYQRDCRKSLYAVVTNGPHVVYLPAASEEIARLPLRRVDPDRHGIAADRRPRRRRAGERRNRDDRVAAAGTSASRGDSPA